MKINPKIKKLYKSKYRIRRKWCKGCCDSGCDDVDHHEMKLMQFAYDLCKGENKK